MPSSVPPRLGPNSPLLAAQGAAKGATRAGAGRMLEDIVDAAGAWYARRGLGVFVQNHVPTKVVTRPQGDGFAKVRVATGAAIVDRSGHVVRPSADGHPSFMPVYFDVKGFATNHAGYQHERDALHQLDFLLERHRDGVLAFLLLIDDTAGRCWVLHGERRLTALRNMARVPVCERRGQYEFANHFLPNVARTPDGERDQAPGYDFVPLLYRIMDGTNE